MINFSSVLCSTTHHGVKLLLGINQEGNPFTLVETGDTLPVYSSQEEGPESLPIPGHQYCILSALWFKRGWSSILSNQLTHCFLAHMIKKDWLFVCHRCSLNTVKTRHIDARAWCDQPIDGIRPPWRSVKPSSGQSGVLQVTLPLGHWIKGSSTIRILSSSIMGHHPQSTGGPIWEGSLTSLQRCSRQSYRPRTQGVWIKVLWCPYNMIEVTTHDKEW